MTTLFNKDALQGRMLFAIPKKGRLYEKCLELLAGADIQFRRQNRLDVALVQNHPMALVFLPAADIPRFVGEGNVDLGITGQDVVVESGLAHLVAEEMTLGFGKCALQVQVPEVDKDLVSAQDLVGKKVATSFDVISRKYFAELDEQVNAQRRREAQAVGQTVEEVKTTIEYVGGSVEAACALGVADGIGEWVPIPDDRYSQAGIRNVAKDDIHKHLPLSSASDEDADDDSFSTSPLTQTDHLPPSSSSSYTSSSTPVDLVESGETMRACGLHAIATLMTSEAALIRPVTPHARSNHTLIKLIVSRIRGVIAASQYVLCQYNIHRSNLDAALKITPGRRAATVSPLEDEGWNAVSSMVKKSQVATVMDRLEEVGGTDIFTLALDNCRT